jgi:hypothetical protein
MDIISENERKREKTLLQHYVYSIFICTHYSMSSTPKSRRFYQSKSHSASNKGHHPHHHYHHHPHHPHRGRGRHHQPCQLASSSRSWYSMINNPVTKCRWIIRKYGRTRSLFHAIRIGEPFVTLPVIDSLLIQANLSRYFLQRLMTTFGKQDRKLIEIQSQMRPYTLPGPATSRFRILREYYQAVQWRRPGDPQK